MLKKKTVVIVISIVTAMLLFSSLFSEELTKPQALTEIYFKFSISSKEEIETITRIVSIDNVEGNEVYAYAHPDQLKKLKELGYIIEILPKLKGGRPLTMAYTIAEMADWDRYPIYDVYLEMMCLFGENYPDICRIDTVGYSQQGREILFAKISDNVDVEENEPEFMYTAQMHGDELVTYIMMLRLIDYLLTNYGTDTQVTNLVDNIEIWINPLANPDGTYHGGNNTVSGAQRCLANGVDPNRNFPDPEDGPHPDGHPWAQETIIMMDFADSHSFVHSANFHSGAEVVNYPWDTWPRLHADDDWYQVISHEYADTVHANSPSGYMNPYWSDNGITNGYAWYTIAGGRQDYMNYFQGCREVTLELSNVKMLSSDQLPAHWNYNKHSFLNYIDNVFYGIKGVVTDTLANPLDAMITVVDHDFDNSEVFTDSDVGDYHRMLLPGTYDLTFSSYGYLPQTITGITVVDTGATIVNVELEEVETITVSGTVKDGDTGAPISGASVEILDTSIPPATTGASGRYTIHGVLEGTYTFQVSAIGYTTLLEEHTVTSDNNVIDFELFEPYLFYDFEDNNGGFTSIPSTGAWEWGEPTAGGIYAYSGVNVWATNLDGYYNNSVNWYLDSPEFLVSNNSNLSFYHYYDFEGSDKTLWDGGNVKISTDGGSTFTLITPLGGYDGTITALGEPGFGGSTDDWEIVEFDLGTYTGDNVIIRWHFASDGSVNHYYGWYIDDVAITIQAGVDDYQYETPYKIVLHQNYPNPFGPRLNRGSTTISFSATDLHPSSAVAMLRRVDRFPQIKIYNVKGQIVKQLKIKNLKLKINEVVWDGKDDNGKQLPNGIYLYKLTSGNYKSGIKKMILLK
ncbi:MAG: M14 family zinc carboxypeptidase [Candidatus Cloacimonadota bacterium]|nr:M14 family zinc carboxypeptidase [Candidatus Cloacimonadota bacterium]